jgi:hypothetical protein
MTHDLTIHGKLSWGEPEDKNPHPPNGAGLGLSWFPCNRPIWSFLCVWIFIELTFLNQKKSGRHGIDPMAAEASYSCLFPMTSKSAVIGKFQHKSTAHVNPH